MEKQVPNSKNQNGKNFFFYSILKFRKNNDLSLSRNYRLVRPWMKYLTLFPAFLYAYKLNVNTRNYNTKTTNAKHFYLKNNKKTVVHGWIKCSTTKKGVANATINIISNGKIIAKSISFANGSYFISIPNNEIWKFKIDVEYNCINYYTKIIKDVPVQQPRIACDINLSRIEYQYENISTCGGYEQRVTCSIANTTCCYPATAYESFTYCPIIIDTIIETTITKKPTADTLVTNETLAIIETKAFPNPFRDNLQIVINNSNQAIVYVFDVNGKLINTINTTESNLKIDFIEQPNGIYIIKTIDVATQKSNCLKVVKTS